MKPFSPDTHPIAQQVQIALLRNATGARRAALALSLSETTRRMARRAIRRAHPEASEEEIDLIFVALHYGQELADRLRADLQRRKAR